MPSTVKVSGTVNFRIEVTFTSSIMSTETSAPKIIERGAAAHSEPVETVARSTAGSSSSSSEPGMETPPGDSERMDPSRGSGPY
jgi:hypothetical protein